MMYEDEPDDSLESFVRLGSCFLLFLASFFASLLFLLFSLLLSLLSLIIFQESMMAMNSTITKKEMTLFMMLNNSNNSYRLSQAKESQASTSGTVSNSNS